MLDGRGKASTGGAAPPPLPAAEPAVRGALDELGKRWLHQAEAAEAAYGYGKLRPLAPPGALLQCCAPPCTPLHPVHTLHPIERPRTPRYYLLQRTARTHTHLAQASCGCRA